MHRTCRRARRRGPTTCAFGRALVPAKAQKRRRLHPSGTHRVFNHFAEEVRNRLACHDRHRGPSCAYAPPIFVRSFGGLGNLARLGFAASLAIRLADELSECSSGEQWSTVEPSLAVPTSWEMRSIHSVQACRALTAPRPGLRSGPATGTRLW